MNITNLNLSEIVYPDFDAWVDNGIYSERLDAMVAPEDFWVLYGNNRKEYWAYDELEELEQEVLIPNGWRLLTDSEWLTLLEEFGTRLGETSHRLLMSNLGLKYGGYVDDIVTYNNCPYDPSLINDLGYSGYYIARDNTVGTDDADSLATRYLYYLKECDAKYNCDYIAIGGNMVREAYLVRCVSTRYDA